ncbi:MAG: hypothetical protein QOG64_2643, partial [Acidimicrobiaceae bacterium]|nr:hypothetical protein [Acidimicrobiaceae bacterium]
MTKVTIVGGGLAGLVSSIACAEAGAEVHLLEAHGQLGGRARTAAGAFAANLGPHVLYCDGPLWDWLEERDLLPEMGKPPLGGIRFRHGGHARRLPPRAVLRAVPALVRGGEAPVDVDFRTWARDAFGPHTAARLSAAAGVVTFDADPGRLSAAFVWSRLLRAFTTFPPAARYARGGWGSIVAKLEARAGQLGVVVEAGVAVESLPPAPVIVATSLAAARRLLADDTLRW